MKPNNRCLLIWHCLLSGTTVTKQAGANANQALQLPKRCGEKVNAGLCKRNVYQAEKQKK
ncbi:hypothetical protein FCM35_KLT16136 [Carex littledalei]|uniref:Uncharacterized protein n=1 Tax=Carex littledalei TaxID=544730 RepID=A0A833VSK2_9POAL|nr:hypothetical protein FCM35_KLT16136 [Carex littledalei]